MWGQRGRSPLACAREASGRAAAPPRPGVVLGLVRVLQAPASALPPAPLLGPAAAGGARRQRRRRSGA